MKKAADDLGFYFMVFQPNPAKNRIKAWLDGEKAYTFYTRDQLLDLVPTPLMPTMKEAMNETSLFLWDVMESQVRRLSSKGTKIPIGEWIKSRKTENAIQEEKSIQDSFWNAEPLEDHLIIKK